MAPRAERRLRAPTFDAIDARGDGTEGNRTPPARLEEDPRQGHVPQIKGVAVQVPEEARVPRVFEEHINYIVGVRLAEQRGHGSR